MTATPPDSRPAAPGPPIDARTAADLERWEEAVRRRGRGR
jgi:hypothetical protein